MLSQLLRNARNGYGDLAHKQLETKLDMSKEVTQTALALLAELPASAWRVPPEAEAEGEAEGEAEAEAEAVAEAEGEGEGGGEEGERGGEDAGAAPAAAEAGA